MERGWIFVILTCLFELFWIYGFNVISQPWHWFFLIFFMLLDFYFLQKACETLPTGTVYAIFSAIGTAGTTLMDIYLFNLTITISKIFFIFIIILGVICLNLADKKSSKLSRQK